MENYEPSNFNFPNEDVLSVEEGKPNWWILYFDVAINICGNGAGTVIISLDKEQYPILVKLQFECTNNRNGYEVCILSKVVLELNIRKMNAYGDLMLIICQVKREWKTKEEKLMSYQEYLSKVAREFEEIEFIHITHLGREGNQFVDALTTLVSMARINLG